MAQRRAMTPAAALLAAALLAGLATAPAARAADPDPAAAPADQPSIAYLEAMEHEHDEIDFEPGGRVRVPFAPRPADRWTVDGRAPRALPAGLASGAAMAAVPQGRAWVEAPDRKGPGSGGDDTDAPVDAPSGDEALPADGAAWTEPAAAPVAGQDAGSGLRRQVFGFLPYWEVPGAPSKLNYDVLSTIAYFSVGANGRGDLKKRDADGSLTTGWAGWTSSSMTNVIDQAHARGTRVVLTITAFAWTSAQAQVQRSILGSKGNRDNLARQAAAAVRDRGADGINLDFEPLAAGYSDEFVAFLKAVRSELNRVGGGYQLTYDTTGSIGNYPLEASVGSGVADAIFVMGYDYRTGGASGAGSIDPLSGPRYDLTDTVRAYTARVNPSRIILGLPWYGRAWSTTSDDVRAPTRDNGTKYGYSTAVNYESVADLVDQHGRRWDSVEQSPYLAYRRENCSSTYGCVTTWRQVYYDDAASLRLRLAMVNDYDLRGAGMWALGYDGGHAELYRAYAESFQVDTSAPQAGIRALAPNQGDEGFVVAWAAREDDEVASYDVQVSTGGGSWTSWHRGTTATSDVWLGRDGVGYAFRVRARDRKGTVGDWNASSVFDPDPTIGKGRFGRVTTDGLAYRSGPGTGSMRLGSIPAGTVVAFTSGAVNADGWTWYEVTQPVREWSPVSFVERGVWIAVRSSSVTHVVAARAPNTTRVNAGIVGLSLASSDGGGVAGDAPGGTGRAFSPDGDGSRDELRLRWSNTTALDSLRLRVLKPNGTALGSVDVPALAAGDHSWAWNGRVGGSRVADGRYVLQLVATADGRTFSAPSARPTTAAQVDRYAVTVDTAGPSLTSAAATERLISPNGDGVLDRTRLSLASDGATGWTIRIEDAGGNVVRSASGTGGSGALAWAGTSDAGARVSDGTYTARVAAWDAAGNAATRAFAIRVDTRGPAITPAAAPGLFTPNRDGTADTTRLSWTADERGTGWVRLYRGDTRIRAWSVDDARDWAATWNGTRGDGSPAPEGRYQLRVRIHDAAGNTRTASAALVVDRTAGGLAWSRHFHPQDGDAIRADATVAWTLTRDATTTLKLFDAAGEPVRTVWARRDQRAGSRSWTWDGRDAGGAMVPQGAYLARVTVESPLGTSVLERWVHAGAFIVTSNATRVGPGETLTVRFSSVEPLSARPIVTFRQPGLSAASVTATRLADGRYKASFTVRAGDPGAATVRVAATDEAGARNTTTLPITVTR